ncbi:hypothetical protein [Ottowia sp.]|uniref:hypothetical protein n=1 Tax=Ottowia sp. TaxID=1898956 RepID=UPI0025DFBD25|nr:hypothetical protein [Ottowia sp.]MBK6616596.1 hypothetical protein [Ottowia sp.]
MIKANEVFAAVLAASATRTDRLYVAILSYYGYGSNEAESRLPLLHIEDVAAEEDIQHEAIAEALGLRTTDPEEVPIGDLVKDTPWTDWLDRSVLEMPAHSNCGSDCFSLIMRADRMLADMQDVDDDEQSQVYSAVARQCCVFVNG